MRSAQIMLTALTLLVTSLSVSGCAGSRAAAQTAEANPTRTSKKPQDEVALGRLDNPAYLFASKQSDTKILEVKALAYVGCSPKSKRTARGAWGDALTSDVKAVAVSPDLLDMGLDHGNVIHIEGLPGEYRVLDVMHSRHEKTIDIFYGSDRCGAMAWGQRNLTISWQ